MTARLGQRRAEGRLTSAEVRAAATGLAVSERTVWRWLGAGLTSTGSARPRYELTEADRDAYTDWRGNVAAIHRALAGEPGRPALRTLQEASARELTPMERAAAREGTAGRRRHEVYLRWAPEARNALWEADHRQLPVMVRAPGQARALQPWATLLLDGCSRLIMGWALSVRPNAATVLAALRAGIAVDPERGPFGGLPQRLRPDGGLEFAATALARACAALGIELVPTDPYAPHQKGKVERVGRSIDQLLLCGLPFYADGPRGADGTLLGPAAPPMGLELFVDHFAGWVAEYNTVRPHGGLGGQTPLERWCADATPLREVPAEQLRFMLLADVERVVGKDGVRFGGLSFIAPELNGLVGERVQVRYAPHDLRQIELFRGDQWLASARPQGLLTTEERDAVLARRRADAAELARRQRRASRRARARLAPITQPGAIEDTTTISAEQARREQRAETAPTKPAAGLAGLLGLRTDPEDWN